MQIKRADRDMLLMKSAGRCCFEGCGRFLAETLPNTGVFSIAEVAHIIGKSAGGPRGCVRAKGLHLYKNLILLCPTDHTIVDKAPRDFPAKLLRGWKKQIEDRVAIPFQPVVFTRKRGLFRFARRLLKENLLLHRQWGPESMLALSQPQNRDIATLWRATKTTTLIPNNTAIVSAFVRHDRLLSDAEWAIFLLFKIHATAFAANALQPRLQAPRFPEEFERMVSE